VVNETSYSFIADQISIFSYIIIRNNRNIGTMISRSVLTAAICICTLSYSLATQEGNLTNTSNSNSTVSCDCNSCELPVDESSSSSSPISTTEGHIIRILNLKTKSDFAFMGLEKTAKKYYDDNGITIEFDYINDKSLRAQELRNQLQNKLPLYDGFVLPSRLVGTAVQYDGFLDLTDIVRTRRELDWNDIFLGWRENVRTYHMCQFILYYMNDGILYAIQFCMFISCVS